jgi:excinuclease UvrABC nuclease subunit
MAKFDASPKGKQLKMKWFNSWGSGVYQIVNNNECLYVGHSKTLRRRITNHKVYIKNPKTAPRTKEEFYIELQSYPNIEFKILEETLDHKEREKYWINKLKPKYNQYVKNV